MAVDNSSTKFVATLRQTAFYITVVIMIAKRDTILIMCIITQEPTPWICPLKIVIIPLLSSSLPQNCSLFLAQRAALKKQFGAQEVFSVYEAGFPGLVLHRALSDSGNPDLVRPQDRCVSIDTLGNFTTITSVPAGGDSWFYHRKRHGWPECQRCFSC